MAPLSKFTKIASGLKEAFASPNSFKAAVFKRYANNTDRFLLDTAAIGWILASFSNMTSVFFNKKIVSSGVKSISK